ncbi:glycosyl hydrolase 115 family protein [Algoriphagus winogradskyi]|uniref:Glycosyl hydrolase family 67 N-terminus n=1 Tax=Algoriphagus winogradskyi TaxID=237017 RepID=A0ABY1NG63_9BACT|nr:glycosyl hydrolase 115 family protein [Algoriphagus winogradskyi]SMP07074.1 Glycosyl hydrolase family 67 N-terminus [Algoriphagus winogradskyi]
MKKYIFHLLVIFSFSCNSDTSEYFVIDKNSSNRSIFIGEDSDDLVKWAANDLAEDLEFILGTEVTISYTDKFNPDDKGIYIGKFDDPLIESLPEKLNRNLNGEWEKFLINKHEENLFIVGSDIRGTVYGIFELTERIGISPWKWWADVHPEKSEEIGVKLPVDGIEASPSVQYRGIFLNDEDWGLQPWAANTFEPETGDIGPKTYEKIFQLLLRLKANTIWPAMHPSTKAFFSIPGNREMAEKYHISIGTSHAEPMLRNNVDEWDEEAYGDFNYFTNSENVKQYWQERITEAKNGNNIISMGMRGIHDSGMQGNATQKERVELLEQIFQDQRSILSKTIDKPIEEIPQAFTIYKEVLDLYNDGLQVPEDITLVWTDDNYGYIRRLSDEQEQARKGGSGVYYHLSYWGRPHDHLWLSTTQPGLIWYEMTRAYQNGAKKLWIANVGDIKPAEYDIEFFLDLAWDINSISETTINSHLEAWSSREFGEVHGEEIAKIFAEYYRLAFLRKPEYMGWSQTEPTTTTRITEFNSEEANRRLEAYAKLVEKVNAIKSSLSKERLDSYFQLVEYPIKGAALMNEKFILAQESYLNPTSDLKDKLAKQSQQAYDNIVVLTEEYNLKISNGKWNKMMSMHPRDLPVFSMPNYHQTDQLPESKNTAGGPTLSPPIFMQGNEYSNAQGAANYQWKAVEGLGYSNAAMTLFPFANLLFESEKPYLEYQFDLQNPGKHVVELRFLPTHSNNFDQKIWVSIDDQEPKEFSLNTRGRTEEWKENVLRNFVKVTYPILIDKSGKHSLKISVNQVGIVLDQLAISQEGQEKFYEIVK